MAKQSKPRKPIDERNKTETVTRLVRLPPGWLEKISQVSTKLKITPSRAILEGVKRLIKSELGLDVAFRERWDRPYGDEQKPATKSGRPATKKTAGVPPQKNRGRKSTPGAPKK